MTAPDKPGLSNEEFIDFNQKFLEKASTKGLRNILNVDIVLAQTLKEALDRLESATKAPVAQVEVYRKALETISHHEDCLCKPGMEVVKEALLTSKPEPVAPVCEKCGHEEAHDKTYRRLNYPEDADKPARFGLCGHDLCTCTFQTIQPEVAPVRKWEDEDVVGSQGPYVRGLRGEDSRVYFQDLSPEVQAALSGGGDERWVLDELKSIVKDLAETDRPEPTKENMWFRNLRVRASKLMPSLESQASGKVKPNE